MAKGGFYQGKKIIPADPGSRARLRVPASLSLTPYSCIRKINASAARVSSRAKHYLSDRTTCFRDERGYNVPNALMNPASPRLDTWSPSLQVFLYLQLLDALTTLLGFRAGLVEASPFVRVLVHFGPLAGLLADKVFAVFLAVICVWSGRSRMIRWVNYWYAALVTWNIILILAKLS